MNKIYRDNATPRERNIAEALRDAQKAAHELQMEIACHGLARAKRIRNLYDDLREEQASLELQMASLRKHKPGQEARAEAKRGRKPSVRPVTAEDFDRRWDAALKQFNEDNDLVLNDEDYANHLSALVIHMEATLGMEVQDASQAEPVSEAALREHYRDMLGLNQE